MISTAYSPTSFNGDGVTVAFPITWSITASSEVVVTEVIIATGVETVKTLTTHYTVTGTTTFTVTAVTAPASTVRWVISRAVARTQAVDYVANDPFPAATHETALDKLTMLVQDVDGKFNRALRQPNGDSASIGFLPAKVSRASLYLGFDAAGDPVALAAPANTTPVTAFVTTLLDDTTLLAFLQTMGLAVPSWTPVLTAATPGNLAVTYSTQTGLMWKFGRLGIAWFDIVTSAFTHTTASGNMRITGLTPPTIFSVIGGAMQHFERITKANYTHFSPELDTATNIITLAGSGSAQLKSPVAITEMPTAGTVRLSGYVIYYCTEV